MDNLTNNNTRGGLSERTECIVYSRVVGWLTPVKNFNPGKASEFKDRITYDNNIEKS